MNSRLLALSICASLLVAPSMEARTVSITAENYKSVSARRPVLVYMSLGCDMGSYASELFQNAFYDLEGVDLAVFDANQGYKITDGKPYDLGTM
ncbi:MAG: hypothetical protein KDK33_06275, partial [Leptospiraceae bacterium]|nr:hypothetical protein [Leptospiraceae bacterium]